MLSTGELTLGNVPVEASLGRCFEDVLKQSDYVAECQRIEDFNKYVEMLAGWLNNFGLMQRNCLPAQLSWLISPLSWR